jgi:predicted nucleotidyltransferase
MNIHFNDIELFEKLKSSSIIKIEFGSTMYGLNDSNSDIDFLYVYVISKNELNSFLKSHHQLQFKENGIDHNFINIHQFITNTISGDSTINFECINSDKLLGTDLEFLYNLRSSFNTDSVIRSYLGLAKRDHKHYFKETNHRTQLKRIIHIYRGYYYAKTLMDKSFTLLNKDVLSIAKEVRTTSENDFTKKKEYLTNAINLISISREELNNLKIGTISKNMDIISSSLIDKGLNDLMNKEEFKYKQDILKDFDMSVFYNAFENWVSY